MKARSSEAELEALVLARARTGFGPTASERQAILGKIAGRVAAEPLNEPMDGASVSSAASPGGFSLQAMVAGITAGALIGFGAGYLLRSPQPEITAVTTAHAPEPSELEPRALEPSGGNSVGPASIEAAELVAGPAASSSLGVDKSTRTSPSARGRPPGSISRGGPARATSTQSLTSYDELAYIRRANLALKRGEGQHALGLLRELEEQQGSSRLDAERKVTEVLALCQLGRSEEARALAVSVLKEDPAVAVYAQRLATSCAASEVSGKKSETGSDVRSVGEH